MKQTKSIKPVSEKDVKREWHLIDMSNQTLGRVVTKIATLLQGKHKVNYVPSLDMGDNVVIINAQKVTLTGKKSEAKTYSYYSGYPGGLREVPFKRMLADNPKEVVRHAVAGMLPKNKLRDRRLTRLHIYPDVQHPHGDKFESKA